MGASGGEWRDTYRGTPYKVACLGTGKTWDGKDDPIFTVWIDLEGALESPFEVQGSLGPLSLRADERREDAQAILDLGASYIDVGYDTNRIAAEVCLSRASVDRALAEKILERLIALRDKSRGRSPVARAPSTPERPAAVIGPKSPLGLLSLLWAFAGGILLFYALPLSIAFAFKLPAALASLSWPSTEGDILSSQVERFDGRTRKPRSGGVSATYRYELRYRYRVGGRVYAGSNVWAAEATTSDREAALSLPRKYPSGAKARVFYDPEAPQRAVLEPGLSPEMKRFFLLALLGLVVVWSGARGVRRALGDSR